MDVSADAKKASIFGGARPREEVIKQRGGSLGDPCGPGGPTSHGSAYTSRPASSATSFTSGADADEPDQWAVVGARRRAGAERMGEGHADLLVLDADPFFGGGAGAGVYSSGSRAVPPGRGFGDGGRVYGTYGSPHGRAGGFSGGQDDEEAGGGAGGPAVFKRALPTRQDYF